MTGCGLLLWAAAAQGQGAAGMMNAREAMDACMMGAPVADKELQAARAPAEQVLLSYFALVQGGKDRSPVFHMDSNTRWSTSQISASAANLNQPGDMLAASGNRIDGPAGRFFRSSRYPTALGQWPVRDAKGALAGVYTAVFGRQEGAWKLRTLEIAARGERVTPISAFCQQPGDVLAFRSQKSRDRLAEAEARYTSAQNSWNKAEADAAARENAASLQPASLTRADAASKARAVARQWVDRVNERQHVLRAAQAEEVRMMRATVALQPVSAAALFGQ
jgi:hypothetical protein